MLRLFATITKIALASMLTGAVLSALDISAVEILSEIGLTPEQVFEWLTKGLEWAVPNIVLGSMVIVPVWIVIYLFRPPRG
ncbi:MAG: hypothetical protein C0606_15345 [Hyphomicrobiales bacterium]|nr:MAG: hypothetical protein C0606_15345 [Hyphomicrobiales bacterium]